MDTSMPQQPEPQNAQLIHRSQPPAAVTQPGGQGVNQTQAISGAKEQEPIRTSAVVETVQAIEDQEQPVKQEAQASPIAQPIEDAVEVKSSVPEIKVEATVENVVEKSLDQDKPKLDESLQKIGVTHSGPGVPVQENNFAVTALPMDYQHAAVVDKQTTLKESKHWLAELVMYVWRKVDPKIDKKGDKQ